METNATTNKEIVVANVVITSKYFITADGDATKCEFATKRRLNAARKSS